MCIHPSNFRGCIGRPFYVLTNPVYATGLSTTSTNRRLRTSLKLMCTRYYPSGRLWTSSEVAKLLLQHALYALVRRPADSHARRVYECAPACRG